MPVNHVLVGRDKERLLIGELVAAITVQGAALVLAGEPGIGKTALLDYAAADAVPAVRERPPGTGVVSMDRQAP